MRAYDRRHPQMPFQSFPSPVVVVQAVVRISDSNSYPQQIFVSVQFFFVCFHTHFFRRACRPHTDSRGTGCFAASVVPHGVASTAYGSEDLDQVFPSRDQHPVYDISVNPNGDSKRSRIGLL